MSLLFGLGVISEEDSTAEESMQVEQEGEEEVEMKDNEDEATLAAKLAAKKIKAAAMGGQQKSKKKSGGVGEEDDLAVYNLDAYDEEESKGAGKFSISFPIHPLNRSLTIGITKPYSDGSFLKYQGFDLLWKY